MRARAGEGTKSRRCRGSKAKENGNVYRFGSRGRMRSGGVSSARICLSGEVSHGESAALRVKKASEAAEMGV